MRAVDALVRLAITGSVPALAACAPPEKPDDVVARRDSAGIEIVESSAPSWDSASGWRIAPAPRVSIGDGSSDPRYEFSEVADAIVAGESTVVVCDLHLAELRFFSRAGTLIGVFGRRGDGPGEFRRLYRLGRAGGDSVWIYDAGSQRVTMLTGPEGNPSFVRFQPPLRTFEIARMPDGQWLAVPRMGLPTPGTELQAGIHRHLMPILRYGTDGVLRDTLAMLAGAEIVYRLEAGEVAPWGRPLFGRATSVAFTQTGYSVGYQEQFEIREYDWLGSLKRIVRRPQVDLTITQAAIDAALSRRLRGVPEGSRARFRSALMSMPRPDTRPAFEHMLVDRGGNVWVSSVDNAARGRFTWGPDWHVFDPGGVWLGTVTMPSHVQPMDIGNDWVLGIYTDELDVQHVRMYDLLK